MSTTARPVHVGCSGWSYKDWRGVLYPEGLPTTQWLQRYADGDGITYPEETQVLTARAR